MANWNYKLLEDTRIAVQDAPFWKNYLEEVITKPENGLALHLAILVEPYLRFILEGKKTVESRFSKCLCPPHNRVKKGDVVLLKKSGGDVVGLCIVSNVWFYELDSDSWNFLKKKFAKAICAQDALFWQERRNKTYVTLMKIEKVRRIGPIRCQKRDRRGWVILDGDRDRTLFG